MLPPIILEVVKFEINNILLKADILVVITLILLFYDVSLTYNRNTLDDGKNQVLLY